MTIVTIDGNIGSGKSSILNYLHKLYKIPIDLEPVESWSSFLAKLYDNKLDVFKFQVRIWLDRCWVQEKGDTVFVIRVGRDGKLTCSRPCKKCMDFMREHKIHKIYYSDWDGTIKKEKLK